MSISIIKNSSHKKRLATRFVDLENSLFFKSRTDFVVHFFNKKSLKTLDVGNLGDGPINVDVRKIIQGNGGRYVGLDVNQNLAENLKREDQLVGDLHNLSEIIGDQDFDCVYMGQVIEHTWKPGQMIGECNRILKDGGYLVLDTPNSYDLVDIARFFFNKKDTVGAGEWLTYSEAVDQFSKLREKEGQLQTQPQHKIFYRPAMLQQLLNMHGFDIEEIAFIGKPRNIFHKILLVMFPHGSQKIGIIARKLPLNRIFSIEED
jgi:ubiquinone/menaquinone biosynthesis C-methylase UbiE